jgi:hypothetical protein
LTKLLLVLVISLNVQVIMKWRSGGWTIERSGDVVYGFPHTQGNEEGGSLG